jgi:LTXXQ motif family protein
MKRGLWIVAAALLTGILGFVIARQQYCRTMSKKAASHEDNSRLPELEWFRNELKLTDEQFAKISELHLAYRPTCEDLCMRIMASHKKIKAHVDGGKQVTPELKAALQEHAALHVECQTAMLTHLYQTSACMSQDQAKNYLDAMLPQVIEMAMEPNHMSSGH